jgi:hypothetical protein
MFFIHPLLLGGLVLAGVPILVHLIMRQKPKHLLFPAVRFLMQKHKSNQRRLQLRHLLLLLLRMAIIAALCLALARPRVSSEQIGLSGDRPVAAVFLFDTRPTMGYVTGGKSRLDEARQRASELLDELPDGSQVAVFDSAGAASDLMPVSVARQQIAALETHPANHPLTQQLGNAYAMLAKVIQEQDNPDETPLPFVYVFSDRTRGSWDETQTEYLKQQRDHVPQPGAQAVYIDVGVNEPVDLAITRVELPREVVPAKQPVVIKVMVQAVGTDADATLSCQIDGEASPDKKPVRLEAGQSEVVVFERNNLKRGQHEVVLSLKPDDKQLPFNNTAYATFEIRKPRQVLLICDDPENALLWQAALESTLGFTCEVKTPHDVADFGLDDLKTYKAICMLDVKQPTDGLWDKLGSYARSTGGGVAVLPGGKELNLEAYHSEAALHVLPGTLEKPITSKDGVVWSWPDTVYQHPMLRPFREWNRDPALDFVKYPRKATRYWEVKRVPGGNAVIRYADKDSRPALLERLLNPGKVLLFTTPLDGRDPRWNDYMDSLTSFGPVLADRSVGYLAGDAEEGVFNFKCGQRVPVVLPAKPRFRTYMIQGPGITGTNAILQVAESQNEVLVTQALLPGPYRVKGMSDEGDQTLAQFSMNAAPEDSDLSRVPEEKIQAVLGPNSILPVDRKADLRELLKGHWSQPVELFPWLMILLLLVLAVENLLANKFYRQEPAEELTA